MTQPAGWDKRKNPFFDRKVDFSAKLIEVDDMGLDFAHDHESRSAQYWTQPQPQPGCMFLSCWSTRFPLALSMVAIATLRVKPSESGPQFQIAATSLPTLFWSFYIRDLLKTKKHLTLLVRECRLICVTRHQRRDRTVTGQSSATFLVRRTTGVYIAAFPDADGRMQAPCLIVDSEGRGNVRTYATFVTADCSSSAVHGWS